MLFTDIVRITSCFNNLFTFLCQHGVLAAQQVCVCGTPMVLKERSGIQDGHSWRCSNKDCRKWRSIRYGSFFEGSHISVIKWVQAIFLWSIDEPNKKIETLTGISLHTIVHMLTAIRSVCSNSLQANPVLLGGAGIIVEIDESMFGHKQKYHRGRVCKAPWVFGMVERETGRAVLVRVPNRVRATLLNVIQRHIRPGTSIYSDEFTPYRTLHQLGYIHLAVNHSKNFVDPNTGVHTNTIEGIWSVVKRKFKRMSGTPYQHLPGYLDEFMWRRRHDDHFVAILEDMAAGF